jgi:hypothetical protein
MIEKVKERKETFPALPNQDRCLSGYLRTDTAPKSSSVVYQGAKQTILFHELNCLPKDLQKEPLRDQRAISECLACVRCTADSM